MHLGETDSDLEEQSQTKKLDHLLVDIVICVYDLFCPKTNSAKYDAYRSESGMIKLTKEI